MNRNKNKGKTYEREVAAFLSKITSYNFGRVPNSGAFTGGKNAFRRDILDESQMALCEGDIITPKEWNKTRIECKFYKDFSWASIFKKDGDSELNKWIRQAKDGVRPIWFLCFKINHQGQYVVFDISLFEKFITPITWIQYNNDYCITELESFFNNNKDIINNLNKDKE